MGVKQYAQTHIDHLSRTHNQFTDHWMQHERFQQLVEILLQFTVRLAAISQ